MFHTEMVTVRMSRGQLSTPWGFDIAHPLSVHNVVSGSLANRAGLLDGDKIVEFEGHDSLDAQLVQQLFQKAEHKIEFIVHRHASPMSRVWKPKITENTQYNKFQHSVHNIEGNANNTRKSTENNSTDVPYNVSLEHQNQNSIPIPGFNSNARSFGQNKEVKHLQYNSPMQLYSPQSAAEQYLQQTGGLFGTNPNLTKRNDVPSYLHSETLRLIQENEASDERSSMRRSVEPSSYEKDSAPRYKSVPPTMNSLPECYICGRNIQGVLCRSYDVTVHAECFKCSTCGGPLKNQGHHFINEKFYCDIHGLQLKGFRKTETVLDSSSRHNTPFNKYLSSQSELSIKAPSLSPILWKTQGMISPAKRGIPSAHSQYGQSLRHESYTSNTQDIVPKRIPNENHAAKLKDYKETNYSASHSETAPYCKQCNRQIHGAYVIAKNETWCPEHFNCANQSCNKKLLDVGFIEDKGKKYCEQCFENSIAPHCAQCNRAIITDCLNALQKQWHPECFVCTHCQKPFGSSAFFLEQGRPYCESDWNKLFTTKCVACNYPIEAGDRWVEALGSAFHSNCFNCTSCHTNLEGESFYAKNGAPYCKLHV